jgi:hypothetical protein
MKFEDVKIGMRVVPFQKTVATSGGFDFNFWLKTRGGEAFLKRNGYVTIDSKLGDSKFGGYFYFVECTGVFSAFDFNPYIETPIDNSIKRMLVRGNRTVIFLQGARKGESVCNAEDTFNPVKGVALAYARALGQEVDDIEIVINPKQSAPQEDKPLTFEVGETVRVASEVSGSLARIGPLEYEKFKGKKFKILVADKCEPKYELGTCFISYGRNWWFSTGMLEKVPQPAKHEVIVDGVKYVKEAE